MGQLRADFPRPLEPPVATRWLTATFYFFSFLNSICMAEINWPLKDQRLRLIFNFPSLFYFPNEKNPKLPTARLTGSELESELALPLAS